MNIFVHMCIIIIVLNIYTIFILLNERVGLFNECGELKTVRVKGVTFPNKRKRSCKIIFIASLRRME